MFKIYHIKQFKKIGITSRNVEKRIREQFRVKTYGHLQYEILEIYDDVTIAAKRERELQKEYGYKIDNCEYDLNRLSNNGLMMGKINGSSNKGKDMGGNPLKRKVKKGYDKSDPKYYGTPAKPIIVYSVQTNDIINNFSSIKAAAKFLNIRGSYITNVIKGRIKNPKRYYFEYEKNITQKTVLSF